MVARDGGTDEPLSREDVSCGPERKTSASERVAVSIGGCAVGSQFGVPGAHGNDAVPDDDGTTSCDANAGACRERR